MPTAVCTTYYVHQIQPEDDPSLADQIYQGQKYGSARGVLYWYDHEGKRRRIYLNPRDHWAARIEGTAQIRWPSGKAMVIQYEGNGIWRETDAPNGLGSRGNALVPGRDIATHGLPWGTRVEWEDIHERLRGKIRRVMYVADVFGVPAADDRMDLFVAPGISEKVRMKYKASKPAPHAAFRGRSGLEIVQIVLARWDLYPRDRIDGISGPLTEAGCMTWLREMAPGEAREDLGVYLDGSYPVHYLPLDPALYWWLRQTYVWGTEDGV